MKAFDWEARGIRVPYLIFITGRCGSTWLSNLLADSQLCGQPHEFFNESITRLYGKEYGTTSLPDYFDTIVDNFSSGGCFGMQVDASRFFRLQSIVEWNQIFDSRSVFISMTRHNVLSQAFSYVQAKLSGHWHDYKAEDGARGDGRVQIDDRVFWGEVVQILHQERQFDRLIDLLKLKVLRITYEDLATERNTTLLRIMRALGVPREQGVDYVKQCEDKTQKLASPTKDDVLSDVIYRYDDIVRAIMSRRTTIQANEIVALLREQGVGLEPFAETDLSAFSHSMGAGA